MASKISRYENIATTVENGTLVIRINIDETKVDAQPSKSGKTLVVATTGGAKPVGDTPLRLNLTLYRYP